MAGDSLTDPGSSYSATVGFLFIFNLIVGTGALTLPKAFQQAGYVLGTIVLCVVGFISYVSATFVLEAMSNANAILRVKKYDSTATNDGASEEENTSYSTSDHSDDVLDQSPLLEKPDSVLDDVGLFQITKRIEMGQMAGMFFNKMGLYIFYACMVIYLYGDLAIYSTAVPKSLRDVACTFVNKTNNVTEDDPCWASSSDLSRRNVYRIFVAVFAVTLGPFVFFNVQKTKYLQVLTSLIRWVALFMMIILACIWLGQGKREGHPREVHLDNFPNIFGIAVYAFMCHHSLPGVVTPIRRKLHVHSLVFLDYISVLILYLVLALTGVFLFKTPEDLYTLNFFDDSDPTQKSPDAIRYFLALFPVFTLSSTFPVVAITLRNNIRTLFGLFSRNEYHWIVDRVGFPLLTLFPPLCIALITNEVQFLVGITGSYAGCAIQYIIPAMLVYCSRNLVSKLTPTTSNIKLPHRSLFRQKSWIIFVNLWALISVIVITINHIIYRK